MAISDSGGIYELDCDMCFESDRNKFDSFNEAIEFKKTSKWTSVLKSGIWMDICPNCSGLGQQSLFGSD